MRFVPSFAGTATSLPLLLHFVAALQSGDSVPASLEPPNKVFLGLCRLQENATFFPGPVFFSSAPFCNCRRSEGRPYRRRSPRGCLVLGQQQAAGLRGCQPACFFHAPFSAEAAVSNTYWPAAPDGCVPGGAAAPSAQRQAVGARRFREVQDLVQVGTIPLAGAGHRPETAKAVLLIAVLLGLLFRRAPGAIVALPNVATCSWEALLRELSINPHTGPTPAQGVTVLVANRHQSALTAHADQTGNGGCKVKVGATGVLESGDFCVKFQNGMTLPARPSKAQLTVSRRAAP